MGFATGTALAIAGLASAGGSVATGLFGQRRQAQENALDRELAARQEDAAQRQEKKSWAVELEAQDRQTRAEREAQDARLAAEKAAQEATLAEQRAAREAQLGFDREREGRRERQWQSTVDVDRERWNAYIEANRPSWELGGRVLGNLYDLAGYTGGAPSTSVDWSAMTGGGGLPSGASGDFQASGSPAQASPWESAPPMPAGGGAGSLAGLMARGTPFQLQRRPVPQAYRSRPVASGGSGGFSLADLMSLASFAGPGRGPSNLSSRRFLPSFPTA